MRRFFRIWPTEKLQCVVSLGLGRFDGHLYSDKLAPTSRPTRNEPVEVKSLSLAQKFSRIIDSATGKIIS